MKSFALLGYSHIILSLLLFLSYRPSTAGDGGGRMNGSRIPTSLPPQYTITVDWRPNLDIHIPETISDEQMDELIEPFPLPVLKVCQIPPAPTILKVSSSV